jgi:hypothetical protein
VRLPIGYWAFDVSGGEPFIQGQLPYLTNAVNWSQTHGLKLIVDLHGKRSFKLRSSLILSKAFRGPWKPEWVRLTRLNSFEDLLYRILGSIILVKGCLSRRSGKMPTRPDADAFKQSVAY